MKRLLLLFAGVFALAVIVAPTASAATTVNLSGTSPVMHGDHVVLTGSLTGTSDINHKDITVYKLSGTSCPFFEPWSWTPHLDTHTSSTGAFQVDFGALSPGTYTFRAWFYNGYKSPCVTVHVAETEPGLWLDELPAQGNPEAPFTVSGTLLGYDGVALAGEPITVTATRGTCSDTESFDDTVDYRTPTTGGGGVFDTSIVIPDTGTYAIEAWSDEWEVSDCAVIEIVSAPTTPKIPVIPSDLLSSSYLCWNQEMTNPIAYIDRVADEMWATGKYFEPIAVAGHLEGGTNIGAYHLICNPAGLVKTTASLGSSGEVYGEVVIAGFNLTHATGNDLNQYHIWTTK